jgi:hypothetical protein
VDLCGLAKAWHTPHSVIARTPVCLVLNEQGDVECIRY